jgi:hypothetical protein
VQPLVLTLYSSSFCGACARTRQVLEDATRLVGGRTVLREVNVAVDPDESERRTIVAGVPTAPQVLSLIARHLPED